MKKLIVLIFVVFGIAIAGKPTPRLSNVSVIKTHTHFVATWIISTNTTNDTLIAPFPGKFVEIVHNGATTGDTVQVDYGQSGTAGFTEILTKNRDTAFREFCDLYNGTETPMINRVIIKGNGIIPVWVRIYY